MKTLHERPDYVLRFDKPKNTEIKHINGRWYLYERTTVYDPETGRSTKKSGRMIGAITEDGLVGKRVEARALREVVVVEAGATQYLYRENGDIRRLLGEHFPDCRRELFSLAVIRMVQDRALKRAEAHYETSILSAMWPGLRLDGPSLTGLLRRLGRDRLSIRAFMRSMAGGGDRFLMVDGHRILSASATLESAEKGYDSKRRYKRQVNLLYLFGIGGDGRGPRFYKKFPGSITDDGTVEELLREAGVEGEDCTLVGDKGFYSNENFDLVEELGLGYIIPLDRGSKVLEGEVPPSHVGYGSAFSFRRRSIYAKRIEGEGWVVHLFLDPHLLAEESADLVARLENKNAGLDKKRRAEHKRRAKGKGRLTEAELAALEEIPVIEHVGDRREMGTIAIRTNRLDLNSNQVYAIYKERQSIEQLFKTYDCTYEFDASYMQDDYAMEGWLFLNHLTMVMAVRALDMIADLDLTDVYSLDDLTQHLRKIKASKVDGKWYPTKVAKKVQTLCENLGISLGSVDQIIEQERASAP